MKIKYLSLAILLMFSYSFVKCQHKFRQINGGLIPGPVIKPVYTQQGYNMKLWMSNSGEFGFSSYDPGRVNLEYPVGSGVEHLYGGGLIIGAVVHDSADQSPPIARVTEMYNAYDGRNEARSNYNHFWQTSINTPDGHNRRHYDDDGDGKIDEDELDGEDNDGDWNPLTDDVGADGLSDKFEISCDGIPYDSLTNPDPADDNYNSEQRSKCPVNYTGVRPYKNDINIYTENNHKPDHGEPHVDEDYGAISNNDLYCTYTDTFSRPIYAGHVPMGIKVLQRSFAWETKVKEPILPMEYTIVNISNKIWKGVYLGFFLDPDVGPTAAQNYYNHNYIGYMDTLGTFYCHNPIDRGSTPLGLTLINASRSLDSLRYIFYWSELSTRPDNNANDDMIYEWMSGGFSFPWINIPWPTLPTTDLTDERMFISFGPFSDMYPGDTVKLVVAFVSGDAVSDVANSLRDNAARAISIYKHDYENLTIPSPPLHLTREGTNIKLDWQWKPGDAGINPVTNWEDDNEYFVSLPDTHWRKKNPPFEKIKGGRNFEGFKIWRSESDTLNLQSFALLAQYDVNDDLGLGAQTGLRYTYTDSTLKPYNKYWYAVTSYSIPEAMYLAYPDAGGVTRHAKFVGNGVESAISENAHQMHLIFEPSKKLGEVLVVPNPYRADVSYIDGLGFEGASYNWTPDKRVLWFIHLPAKATIRIYTIAGEVIKTIQHDDAYRIARGLTIGQDEWDMSSESGIPAASGVFVFSVDSDFGQQIGKFVIIK